MNAPPLLTVLVTLAFAYLLYLMLRPGAKKRYEELGKLPFADEHLDTGSQSDNASTESERSRP